MKSMVVRLVVPLSGLLIAGAGIGGSSVVGMTKETVSKEAVARGELLVTVGGCGDCHTPKKLTPEGPVPDTSRNLSGTPEDFRAPEIPGGVISPNGWGALASHDLTVWAGPWGVSFASNLTPDETTGLGSWTEAAFVNTMRTGKHKGVLRKILPPMPWQNLSGLNDDDLKAIFAYLKSIEPIQNRVPPPIPPKH